MKDAEEQSMEDFVLGMDFALMEMESETLRQIDEAIQRLDDGTYGVCSECDETISEARLKALPFATVCRDCQAQREDDQAARNARPSRFFEDAPPAAARERRNDKPAKSWSAPVRAAAVPPRPRPRRGRSAPASPRAPRAPSDRSRRGGRRLRPPCPVVERSSMPDPRGPSGAVRGGRPPALPRATAAAAGSIRTALSLVMAPLTDALDDAEHPLTPVQRERIELARRSACAPLAGGGLLEGRPRRRRRMASYAPTDLSAATREFVAMFRSAAALADVELTVESEPAARAGARRPPDVGAAGGRAAEPRAALGAPAGVGARAGTADAAVLEVTSATFDDDGAASPGPQLAAAHGGTLDVEARRGPVDRPRLHPVRHRARPASRRRDVPPTCASRRAWPSTCAADSSRADAT